ncbi:hypothetical protein DL98DRAFT_168683 [Cadophora sp. DSE1049]|nr:hypothetical protein DL98DRAFT_168683 [Cadophora sp. DSE1049]
MRLAIMHRDVKCSTIVLSLRGDVKVANPEGRINIGPRNPEMREYTKALGFVMLQLMERSSRWRERLALEHPGKCFYNQQHRTRPENFSR